MTPGEAFFIGVAPAGGGLALLSEAFSRKRDLLPLVRNPVRPLVEQGDGFVHARGKLETTAGRGLTSPDGRMCVSYTVRVETRSNLGDTSNELWRRVWRPMTLLLRDDTGTARLDASVALYFPWRECAFELIREADDSIRLQPASTSSDVPFVGRGPERGGSVQQVRDDPDELQFARAILTAELEHLPPALLPTGAVRHAVILWAAAPDDVRLFGPGRVLPEPEGDRGGGYRELPSRLVVSMAGGGQARAEAFGAAEKVLRVLRLQYQGGLGLLFFGAAWAFAFFLS